MPTSRLFVDISSDLVFVDSDLESEFRKQHTEAQKKLDIQFHYARSLAWLAVALRMLKDSSAFRDYGASFIVLFGAATTLIPAWAHSWDISKSYVKYRPMVVFFDNVMQVVLGCFTHEHIYPENASSWRTASTFHAVGVLLTGSGVAWLNMSGLLGSLIFRYAMGQQAMLAILMLLASPPMCRRSYSLQKGHMAVHSALLKLAKFVLPWSIFQSIPFFTDIPASGTPEDAAYALSACLVYQPMIIMLFGLVAPTMYLFWREMQSRKQFAELWGKRVPSVSVVALNPPPSMLSYFAYSAPAVAAIFYYVVVGIIQ